MTPKLSCPANVTEVQAVDDYAIQDLTERKGMYHCFCSNMATAKGTTYASNYVFVNSTAESKNHCKEWVTNSNRHAAISMMIPGIIGGINIGVEIIIGFGSELISRPRNYQNVVLEAFAGICGIQFINLSLLFVLISINSNNFLNAFGVLQGPYPEMNAAWFIEYGTMIVETMILEIPIPHGFPCFLLTIYTIMRFYDRRWKCNKQISRKYIQADYEDLYVGPEFLLDARLAQVVAVIWVTFIYAPVLPLLLPLSVINLSNIYWVDKILVLRFYKTPRNYDERIIRKQVSFLKLTFPFHFIAGLIFLSNTAILQSNSFENKNETVNAVNAWAVRHFGFNLLSDQF